MVTRAMLFSVLTLASRIQFSFAISHFTIGSLSYSYLGFFFNYILHTFLFRLLNINAERKWCIVHHAAIRKLLRLSGNGKKCSDIKLQIANAINIHYF